MLHSFLSRLAKHYVFERGKQFSGSEFANFVRHDIALAAKKQILFLPFDLTVKASVGNSQWASVPWLGFFDPLVTTSATRGFYVVYLINPQTEQIVLSLNQGTTEAYQLFGEKHGRDALRRRAKDIEAVIPDYVKNFSADPISLGSDQALPLGYEAGHSFGSTYHADELNQDTFYADLERMLYAYEALIDSGWPLTSQISVDEETSESVIETKNYILSKRIERSPNVRPRVLELRGLKCEACGLEPSKHLGYEGSLKRVPLDVHHLEPMSGMREGESRRYNLPDDFRVLCPTCHRMIHKLADPNDVQALVSRLSFRHT